MIKRFLMVVMLFTTLSLMADSSYYDFNGKKVVLQQRFELIALHGGTVGESVMDSLSTFKGRLSINRVSSVTNYKDWKYLADKLATFGVSAWPVVIDNAGNQMILDGTIGIEFNKGISELQQRDIVEKLSLEIIEIDALNPHFLMVAVQMGADPFAISRTLFEQGFVRWAQPNWFSKYVSKAAPNDPYYPNQWHLDQIAAESAWDFETGDSSVKIAIVDSGVETDHPDLIVTTGYDYLDGDSNPNPDTAHDDHYGVPHGTSVAGIAASRTNNSLGVAGVCQNCTIIPIRLIGGYISSYTLRNALKYAVDQGAWVVNNSWGPSNSSCNNISANSFQASAVEYGKTDGRGGKGTIMVWAAGNDSCDTSTDGDLKNNDIVVVSALTSYGSFASYSNYGDEVDVSAGAASYTTDIVGAYGYNYQSGGSDGDGLSNLDYTSVFSGTSAAAPVVSGAIALMLSANPELTFSGALNCLKSTAKKITKYCSKGGWTTQSDIYLESGSKEHSPCFGFGRVDVNLMVQGAINGTCGTCVKIADVDLCYGAGSGVDDDCEGGIDDNCTSGGNGKAGDACDANSECANTGSDFFCKTAWQDGYCSGNCSSDGDCYGSGVSVCRDSECRKTCVSSSGLRDGYKCEGGIVIPGIPVYEPYCGDSVVEGDEECDDGNKVSGDGCNFVCQKEPECEDGTMECRYTALFWCNGGFWEIVRDCVDEGKFCETNAFTSYCETPGICGNSTKESGEECDDGNTVTEQCSYGKTECIVCAS
ncbi:S8 family serine peptidase, partial [bacterium]|nr:S8 family serine peptidase [bacterium]